MNSITFSSSAFVAGNILFARRSLSMPTTLRMPAAAAARAAKTPAAAEAGKRKPRGITKPKPVSPALQAVVGVKEIPRTQALKVIWAYIKENNLQDPENKKIIVCDEKLQNIFAGKDRVGFLEISGLLNPHFEK
ncbi:upstream activation factor subunit spp27-like [Iris pallida]|uniref:Upstream activation factor subunit spp27-like n=1 Tax=Iris pallida TaxID=29817 RepID=A0AAX6FVE9_IRIPA|nr:upstream activation factor subunit spp27-like [Iris pallida]KAJ6839529.1 upstream activation factor subunit spp27-like [Iris pallida]